MNYGKVLRGGFVAALAGAILIMERRRRARVYVEPPLTHRTRNLVVAGLAAATVNALEAPVVVPLARLTARRRWGLTSAIPNRTIRDLLAIVLLDYTLYLWHIVVHRVPWLWRFHLVHHVDLDLDASTGLRFHAGEIAASIPWRALQVVIIGVSPRALTTWQTLTIGSILFHHSNIRLSQRTNNLLSWLIATPTMHAIHHSIDVAQMQSNFSSGLAIWDRLHRTLRLDADAAEVTVGVAGHLDRSQSNLGAILTLPFSSEALLQPRVNDEHGAE